MVMYEVSSDLIVKGRDLDRNRRTVEAEKLAGFPAFDLYGRDGTITSAKGVIRTTAGNSFTVRISWPEGYPYSIPSITVLDHEFAGSCPHRYTNGNLCVMRSDQWSSSMTLAFMVAKTAIWLDKYEQWRTTGRWPGRQQSH